MYHNYYCLDHHKQTSKQTQNSKLSGFHSSLVWFRSVRALWPLALDQLTWLTASLINGALCCWQCRRHRSRWLIWGCRKLLFTCIAFHAQFTSDRSSNQGWTGCQQVIRFFFFCPRNCPDSTGVLTVSKMKHNVAHPNTENCTLGCAEVPSSGTH